MPLFYEDYEELDIGHIWRSKTRYISQADINRFADFTGDTNPVHIDVPYAAQSSYSGPIAHGYLTISLAAGLVYQLGLDQITSHAILGLSWRLTHVVRPDDSIYVALNLISRRASKSQPTYGIIERRYDVFNQNEELVAVGDVAMLIMRRSMDGALLEARAQQ
jgi:oxepin-CoA hydrolase/3-oxo-5,6-dehydrosuberyl-CoA semialdehyde dehydrogenase